MRVSSACLGPLCTNCYLVELESGTLLIDPAEDSPLLQKLIGKRRIDAVVLTHGHFDHVGGAWSAQAREVVMHKEDLGFVDECLPGHPPMDRFIADAEEILPGVRVLHVPGHSPGSIALEVADALFVGDVLFAGSIGRTDLPGGSMARMTQSLARLTSLDGDRAVYPGHGEPTRLHRERRDNPYLRSVR